MKILLGHKFFYLTGGADFFFFETGRVLERYGHKVAYFSTLNERNRSCEYSKYFVKPPEYRNGPILRRVLDFSKIIYSGEAKKQFAQLLSDFKPDIVHLFAINIHISPSILDACRNANAPIVMSNNDYKIICPNYKLYHHGHLCEDCKGGRFYMPIINKCCQNSWAYSIASSLEAYAHNILNIYRRNIHTFLFSSEFMANKVKEFWGANTFRYAMLKNPFDTFSYDYSEKYDDFCLYFGRLIDEKGVDVLIKAMSHLPSSVRLVIVGDGPQWNELHTLADRLNLKNVEFAGPKWGKDLNSYLMRARFVIVPSIWNENFPYVILQSFASGKPVIGSKHGGIPELVQDGERGLLYPSTDPEKLANCIQQLWNAPEKAVAMGKKARSYVENEFNDFSYIKSS